MKKYIFMAVLVAAGVISISMAQDVMTVKMKDGTVHEFKVDDVSEVTFQVAETPDAQLSCPDNHHPHLIDRGLPSGTKWACCNVGAAEPVANGGYYAWGETEEKDSYGANTYIYGDPEDDSSFIGTDIAGTKYDVAYVKWGHEYEMATINQFREVKEHCSLEWITLNGKNGCLVTGPNGNSIFMPAAGLCSGNEKTRENVEGSYWSSSLSSSGKSAYGLYCSSKGWDLETTFRAYGRTIRAVGFPGSHTDPDPSCPVAEAIDLGLPSGTKWASWNVGASKPEEYGGYYAWGETEEKDYYDWSTYTHCDGTKETCHYIGDDIAGTQYDVAHVKWGGSWRMPSFDQIIELVNNCTRKWTTQNGVNGIFVTGLNGGTIFLPASGYLYYDGHRDEGKYGFFWSSSLNPSYEWTVYDLFFDSFDNWGCWGNSCFAGQPVRAVCP